MSAATGFALGAIKPEDAVAAFAARKLLRPSFHWQEVWQAEHARAFAVAGVMRLDILAVIRAQLEQAVAEGTDLESFSKALRQQLVAKGWWGNIEITDPRSGEVRTTKFNNARLRLIFDVNMRQSYAAGKWARLQRGRMPYIVYRTMRDERVRASHRPWDNVVLPKDHPWWSTHFPPNGWRCRCNAFATDEAGLAKLRASAPKDAPVKTEPPPDQLVDYVNRETGQTQRVPRGIDPGFAYNPGQEHVARAVQMLERGLARVAPMPGAPGGTQQMVRAVVARTRSEKAFGEFLANPPAQNIGMPVAAVPGIEAEPVVASVAAAALREQAASADYPRTLPVVAAQWALAQTVIDQGQRLSLPGGGVLWWWARGAGSERRVHVVELERAALVWWVRMLATLAPDEAVQRYPGLKAVL